MRRGRRGRRRSFRVKRRGAFRGRSRRRSRGRRRSSGPMRIGFRM